MVQESFYSTTLESVVKRIEKRVAERMFNQGTTIYFVSSNMMFDNVWQSPCPINKEQVWGGLSLDENTFNKICNNFRYCNCDSERGKYIKFYIKEK